MCYVLNECSARTKIKINNNKMILMVCTLFADGRMCMYAIYTYKYNIHIT